MSTRSVSDTFWHDLAKRNDPRAFQNLEGKIEEIRKKNGTCSFDLQDSKGRTPLHIAVRQGNTHAVRFFLSQKANFSIPDNTHRTAPEYLTGKLELASLFLDHYKNLIWNSNSDPYALSIPTNYPIRPLSPAQLSSALKKMLPSPISLPSTPFLYRKGTNDFGRQVERLLLRSPTELAPTAQNFYLNNIDNIIVNIREIGKKEGFSVEMTHGPYYPRDCLIFGRERIIKAFSSDPSIVQKSIDRALSLAIYLDRTGGFKTHIQAFNGCIGANMRSQSSAMQDRVLDSATSVPIYIEGGNVLRLTDAQGGEKVLVGEYHLYQTLCQLRLEKYFDKHPCSINSELTDEKIRKGAEEMYALGLLILGDDANKKSGFLSREDIEHLFPIYLDKLANISTTLKTVAIEEKRILPFDSHKIDMAEVKPLVAKYLAQKEAARAYLAQILEVPPENLHFISQWDYHLDAFLQPGPRGTLLMPDPSFVINFLSTLRQAGQSLGLSYLDTLIIDRLRTAMQLVEKELGSLLQQVKQEVKAAGFTVLPSPGCIYDLHLQLDNYTRHVHFLNALTGWGKDHYYYITLGAQVGPTLGNVFMRFFELFLKQYEPNLKVYYVGENPQKPGDFTQAMELWNQVKNTQEGPTWIPGAEAGVHCLTFELETQDHKDNP